MALSVNHVPLDAYLPRTFDPDIDGKIFEDGAGKIDRM